VQYMLLIYSDEKGWDGMSAADQEKWMREYRTFTEDIARSGHFKAGDRLQPVSTATTVRVRDGQMQATDGPFAETKEQLGGYYLIEAKDLDEAMGIAARLPGARHGSVEVRPVFLRP